MSGSAALVAGGRSEGCLQRRRLPQRERRRQRRPTHPRVFRRLPKVRSGQPSGRTGNRPACRRRPPLEPRLHMRQEADQPDPRWQQDSLHLPPRPAMPCSRWQQHRAPARPQRPPILWRARLLPRFLTPVWPTPPTPDPDPASATTPWPTGPVRLGPAPVDNRSWPEHQLTRWAILSAEKYRPSPASTVRDAVNAAPWQN